MSNDNNRRLPTTTATSATNIEALQAQLAALMAQNEALRAKATKTTRAGELSCKVSQKGAVSVYGLGRFPVTLYASQWKRLSEAMTSIMAFIEDNRSALAAKEEK